MADLQTFTFVFTPEQVNEIASCMQKGPFDLVTKYLTEFRRQIQAQSPQAAPPAPPGNGAEQPEAPPSG